MSRNGWSLQLFLVLTPRMPAHFHSLVGQICSDFCSGFDYFGLEFGAEVSD